MISGPDRAPAAGPEASPGTVPDLLRSPLQPEPLPELPMGG